MLTPLTFPINSSSQVVTIPAATSIDDFQANSFVALIWVETLPATTARFIASKETSGAAFQKEWTIRPNTGQLEIAFNTSGTTAICRAANSAGNVLFQQAWWWLGFTLSSGLVPRIYLGRQNVPFYEVSYVTQTTGTGTADADNAAPLRLGNGAGLNATWLHRNAISAYFNQELTIGQLREFQRAPQVRADWGCAGMWYPGKNGLGPVVDESGHGNTGLITGTYPLPDYQYPFTYTGVAA